MAIALPADWLVPEWPAPEGVRAVVTTRSGGFSGAPYGSLNLGLHVGDVADQVVRNRDRVSHAIGHAPNFMNQVHGTSVLQLPQAKASDPPSIVQPQPPAADAACTQAAGQVCTVLVADCLPVLLCSADGAWVAAAHAGWRGLAGVQGYGILDAVLDALKALQAVDSAGAAPEFIAIDSRFVYATTPRPALPSLWE